MTAVDASVLIALLDDHDVHHGRSTRVLTRIEDEIELSVVTQAEVLTGPVRRGLLDEAATRLREIGVVPVPLTEDDATVLAELRAATRLKLPDCCVLLIAERSGAVATFDDRLAAAATERGIRVER